ncbi:MAG: hypothetical protein JW929_08180 [Anaerolineales bacterium]|nr:hypothetical protein [Anaerolineales bacterium]
MESPIPEKRTGSADPPRRSAWDVLTAAGIALFLINSAAFILLGRFNADEGWYLYAGKLVYEGLRPYQDFLFTQPPLLPYVYGLGQHFLAPSLYLGRVTSAAFSLSAFLLSIKIAVRYGGKTAAGITALLGGTFLFGIYHQTITKTYAITAFLFLLAFFLLASSFGRWIRLILCAAAVLLAVLARLPAVFFAAPFLLYAFLRSGIRGKIVLGALGLLTGLWFVFLALPNPYAELWDVYLNFLGQWGDLTVAERFLRILRISAPTLVSQFPGYILLAGILLILSARRLEGALHTHRPLFLTAAGLFLFGAANLITGGYLVEYDAPLLFAAFPILGIVFAKLLPTIGKRTRILLQLAVAAAAAMGLVRSRLYYYDLSGGRLPIEKIREAAAVVARHSALGDPIFALEGLPVVLEADRKVLPGMEQGQFGFLNADTGFVRALHAVNGEIALQYLAAGESKLVILTDADWILLRNAPEYRAIADALARNYEPIYRADHFGQLNVEIAIYRRRAGSSDAAGEGALVRELGLRVLKAESHPAGQNRPRSTLDRFLDPRVSPSARPGTGRDRAGPLLDYL